MAKNIERLAKLSDHTLIDEEIYIPVSDGIKLAARIWRPASSSHNPVPAVLEYIPYRKRDGTRARDETLHPALAANGYACVRVDMRGSGDSEGLQMDEYLPVEQQDGVEIVAWLAGRTWCTGSVGMFGLSWGAISSLQVAALAPPGLKAIIPVGASVDRYYDDGCYFVGCLAGETVGWGAVMFGFNSRPPDPAIYGADWKKDWLKRLDSSPLFLELWLNHQRRNDYWLQGTVCSDYSRINIPVYAMSGWNDCWPNTVLRLARHLDAPYKGLSGAWGHMYPNEAIPGPGANFVGEATRWFDRWLKGIENGIENEPQLTCFIQDRAGTNALDDQRTGRWVDLESWDPGQVHYLRLYLTQNSIETHPGAENETAKVSSPMSVGKALGEYMPQASSINYAAMPGDQRGDDALSTCFETAPLEQPLEILGTPKISLNVSSSANCAMVAVRLCDVNPNGESALITYGILNLAQRKGREVPLEVVAGDNYQVDIRLNDVGYRLAKNHRLRVAISNSLWPMAWPLPKNHALSLNLSGCTLDLPQPETLKSDLQRELFKPSAETTPGKTDIIKQAWCERQYQHNLTADEHIYRTYNDFGKILTHSTGISSSGHVEEIFTIKDADPLSAKANYLFDFRNEKSDWDVCTKGRLEMTCDENKFFINALLQAFEGNECIFKRQWNVSIDRHGF